MLPLEHYEVNKIVVYHGTDKFKYILGRTHAHVGKIVEIRANARQFYEHGLYHFDIYVLTDTGENRAWKTIARKANAIDIEYNINK